MGDKTPAETDETPKLNADFRTPEVLRIIGKVLDRNPEAGPKDCQQVIEEEAKGRAMSLLTEAKLSTDVRQFGDEELAIGIYGDDEEALTGMFGLGDNDLADLKKKVTATVQPFGQDRQEIHVRLIHKVLGISDPALVTSKALANRLGISGQEKITIRISAVKSEAA